MFLSKKGVYRHLSFYPSDNQTVTGDSKVTVRLFLVIIKPDVSDNEDERFYLPSPFWHEGQKTCRNGKKYMERVRKQIGINKHKFRPQIGKEKNTKELTRISVKKKQRLFTRLLAEESEESAWCLQSKVPAGGGRTLKGWRLNP